MEQKIFNYSICKNYSGNIVLMNLYKKKHKDINGRLWILDFFSSKVNSKIGLFSIVF